MARKKIDQPRPDKGSPAYMQQQYSIARGNLLLAIIFTVINLVLYWTGSGYYFLFSIAVPYYGILLGDVLGFGATMLIVAVVILAIYFLCWIMSKKHSGIMILATVLFVLDCICLIALMILSGGITYMIVDILFHAWIMFYLIQALRYGAQLKNTQESKFETNSKEARYARYTGPEIDGKPEIKNRGPEID